MLTEYVLPDVKVLAEQFKEDVVHLIFVDKNCLGI